MSYEISILVFRTYIEPVYDGRQSPNNPLLLGVPSGFQFC